MGKKIYLTHFQYKVYLALKEIKKDVVYLYEIANLIKSRPSDVFRSLIFLKEKGIIDFDGIGDKWYNKTYKIVIKNIKNIEKVHENAKYVYVTFQN